jgi:hypothetical protein
MRAPGIYKKKKERKKSSDELVVQMNKHSRCPDHVLGRYERKKEVSNDVYVMYDDSVASTRKRIQRRHNCAEVTVPLTV